jgi:tRNA-modifying protein YgfZ
LQGQISQDIEKLAIGQSVWSLVLQPQGKVDGWFRVARLAEDTYQLDIDQGSGAAVLARLQRFMLRTDAVLSLETEPWLAVRGPASEPPANVIALATPTATMSGYDLLGADAAHPSAVPIGHSDAYEALRIRQGIPVHGKELTEKTIPAEAGIVEQSVSFTKGCYVGQELVARIDSRGNNTPRNLAGLIVSTAGSGEQLLLGPGAILEVEGKTVGHVTSAAPSPEFGAIGLAYIARGTDVPGPATVTLADGSTADAQLVALPF